MYVDTHVHLYPGRTLAQLLIAARKNLPETDAPLTLMLTEGASDHAFTRLLQSPTSELEADITILQDGMSLRASTPTCAPVNIIAGRQITTQERLEVLALGTRSEFPDGLPLADAVSRVQDAGALPVIPWALGKWWFQRGTLLTNYLAQPRDGHLALADSAMRPIGFPPSKLFKQAKDLNLPLLAGSDPLPQPGDEKIAASYGINLTLHPDENHLTASILQAIRENSFSLYGTRRSMLHMLRAQLTHTLCKKTA